MAERPHAAAPDTVLQCVDLCKCYNGVVQASDHVNFTLRRGEVHAFLGENGAGKSTLMKMLYGIEQPDEGRLYLSGQPVTLKSPADAIDHGIGMVHQELMLIPHLTVAENITLGQEIKTRGGRLKKQETSRSIRELAASYGLEVDPDALVDKLTIGQRQRVEIVKLLYRKADILIFDEPTALLTPQESDALFDVLRRLRDLGKSTIFITHKLREVYQIANGMTVIRQGRIIGTTTPQETGMAELTQMMVGKTVPTGRRQPHPIGEEVLRVQEPLRPQPRRHCLAGYHLFHPRRRGAGRCRYRGQRPDAAGTGAFRAVPPRLRQYPAERTGAEPPHHQADTRRRCGKHPRRPAGHGPDPQHAGV